MDPESFDLYNNVSIFVEDDTYENINAPQWIDLSAPEQQLNDDTWFCNSDCQHSRTLKEICESTRNSKVKFLRSATISGVFPFRDRNYLGTISSSAKETVILRPMKTKKLNSKKQCNEETENQNPNLLTPPVNTKSILEKAVIASSIENSDKQLNHYLPNNSSQSGRKLELRSTFSARNLFVGSGILNQITEFCGELKNLVKKKKRPVDKIESVVMCELKDRVRDSERVPLLGVKKREL